MRSGRALILVLFATGAGCVRLSQPAPQVRDYRLDYAPPAVSGTPLPAVLNVASMAVASTYDRESIVYRDDTYSVGSYFYHRWASNPGNMIAELLARDLASSGLYRAVQHGPSVLLSDFQLNGQIEEIEERSGNDGCMAHLNLRVVLLRRAVGASKESVLLSKAYAVDEPSRCNDARSLVEAMSRSLQTISSQLQQEIYGAISSRG